MGSEEIQETTNEHRQSNNLGQEDQKERPGVICTLEARVRKKNGLNNKSRMKRELHVRICESLRVRLPRATRLTTGGGHFWPGALNKTPFPKGWSTNKIMHCISDIATDPNSIWKQQRGKLGQQFTKNGIPARFEALRVREGINIKVIIEPSGEGIITGYPVP